MRSSLVHLDEYRVRGDGEFASPASVRWGAFQIPIGNGISFFVVIADDGTGGDGVPATGWEHVSVRIVVDAAYRTNRMPSWTEMDNIKRLFWRDDEVALQIHVHGPAKVNVHPCVLHLWRPADGKFPLPDPKMV